MVVANLPLNERKKIEKRIPSQTANSKLVWTYSGMLTGVGNGAQINDDEGKI